MDDTRYYGAYARIETPSKKEGAALQSADNLVGDVFDIVFKTEGGIITAWMRNKFGAEVAFFDIDTSRRLNILNARGWKLRALLSYVAYTDAPEPGRYWGEAAIVCNAPEFNDIFDAFTTNLCEPMGEGLRPDIELGSQGIDRVLNTKGTWLPDRRVPFPAKEAGTVILKRKRSASEKAIEQGRAGNKGCYIVSWAFIIALIGGAVLLLKSCNIF